MTIADKEMLLCQQLRHGFHVAFRGLEKMYRKRLSYMVVQLTGDMVRGRAFARCAVASLSTTSREPLSLQEMDVRLYGHAIRLSIDYLRSLQRDATFRQVSINDPVQLDIHLCALILQAELLHRQAPIHITRPDNPTNHAGNTTVEDDVKSRQDTIEEELCTLLGSAIYRLPATHKQAFIRFLLSGLATEDKAFTLAGQPAVSKRKMLQSLALIRRFTGAAIRANPSDYSSLKLPYDDK